MKKFINTKINRKTNMKETLHDWSREDEEGERKYIDYITEKELPENSKFAKKYPERFKAFMKIVKEHGWTEPSAISMDEIATELGVDLDEDFEEDLIHNNEITDSFLRSFGNEPIKEFNSSIQPQNNSFDAVSNNRRATETPNMTNEDRLKMIAMNEDVGQIDDDCSW